VKFSIRQILASAAGAVMAAVIASLFGVKGTIIGVAIGSAAATFGTAFVSQSIEHGHKVVKQVAVRVPERATLLRRLGGTVATGQAESSAPEASAVTEEVTTAAAAETVEVAATTAMDDATAEVPVGEHAPEPDTEEMAAVPRARRSIPWRAIAGAAAVVFVLSLVAVTAIELLAGEPLANWFGAHDKSNTPSVGQIFNPPAPAPTTTTTTVPPTTTTTSRSTTTTTSSTTTTTSTTTPGGSTTTSSTAPGSSTTTSSTSPTGSTTTTTG
jgi:hypothetical protein